MTFTQSVLRMEIPRPRVTKKLTISSPGARLQHLGKTDRQIMDSLDHDAALAVFADRHAAHVLEHH